MTAVIKNRVKKILITVLIALAVLITVIAFFVNRYWSPILAGKVRSTILVASDSLYTADFTDADLHIVQGKLVIFNLTLKPNIKVYNRKLKQGTAPNNLYTLKVKRIVFKHIHPFLMYYDHKLEIGQIVISKPTLQVHYRQVRGRDTVEKNQITAWQRISPMLKSVHIKQVMLNDVDFTYNDRSGNTLKISAIKEVNLTGNELRIDSLTQHDSTRFYYFKELQIELNNINQPLGRDSLYRLKLKQLNYSTLTSKLLATGVGIVPAVDSAFIKKGVRTYYQFDTDTLQLNDFSLKKFNKFRIVYGSNLLLNRGNFVVFANRGLPVPKGNRLQSFPNVALQRIPNSFTLDTVELRNINITYKGYGRRSRKQGSVSFNGTSGSIYNITNNARANAARDTMRIEVTTRLMDSAPLHANIKFNLTDSAKSYSYKGWIGNIDLDRLNKATMPFALIKITSGWLDHMDFDIQANKNVSWGKVALHYHDLKVHLLKVDSAAGNYKHRMLVSLMANALIVKRNNPEFLGAVPRSVNVRYVREPDTPFFKAVMKTLAQGIKASVGYDAATEKHVKQMIVQRKLDKKRRQNKRELRQRRRNLRRRKGN
ncbi:hypothetical protein [Mucilaginibacter aquatilis]|uniref:DUF748 domain-containing protein n=1 Tax=Mucilaginibacter aquatilis TaxID=1517760 RepID=A0A6I4IPM8_9SPHI|nr:hypothetical protein [Mucilaginibacter aquatilis]MVN90293.1 hypothetical protein [Mucilaginibacter aquatilis]